MILQRLLALMLCLTGLAGCGTQAPPPGTPPLPKQEEAPSKPPYSDTDPTASPPAAK